VRIRAKPKPKPKPNPNQSGAGMSSGFAGSDDQYNIYDKALFTP